MDKRKIIIEPSILSGDFGAFTEEAKKLQAAGAEAIHIDVMDGHFVKAITFGPKVVAAIRRAVPDMFLDVHLMMYNPEAYFLDFIESGASRITFHVEACEKITKLIGDIKSCGVEVGIALSPETGASQVLRYVAMVDLILVMTVHPGKAGQEFLPDCLEKVKEIRKYADAEREKNAPLQIQVDGGINFETAKIAARAGANNMVAGTSLYREADMREAIEKMQRASTEEI